MWATSFWIVIRYLNHDKQSYKKHLYDLSELYCVFHVHYVNEYAKRFIWFWFDLV